MNSVLPRFSDFGTMLEIRDIQYFPDGQAVVDCVGGRRFKVNINIKMYNNKINITMINLL